MSKEITLKEANCTSFMLSTSVAFAQKDTGGKEGDFTLEAYTGEIINCWWGSFAVDIEGITFKSSMPIFRDHVDTQIVGYTLKGWKDGSFFVSGKFSNVTEHAKEVRGLAAEGFPWQASIGVSPLRVLQIESGETYQVNGKTLIGPGEVWLESKVFETSFVPLGADDNTSVTVFSKFDEKSKPSKGETNMAEEKRLTLEEITAEYPEHAEALKHVGVAEGAEAERERVQAVFAQSMPGHEILIEKLAFDGKTTGPEAAVEILKAEKQIRENARANFEAEKTAPAAHTETSSVETPEAGLTGEQKWEKDADLRAEFSGDLDAYKAYLSAIEKGQVRVISKK